MRSERAILLPLGAAVDLLEALSLRRPFAQPVPAEAAWILGGLAASFDLEASSSPRPGR